MFQRLSPFAHANFRSPILQLDMRRWRRLRTPQALGQFNRVFWIGIPILLCSYLIWGFISNPYDPTSRYRYGFYSFGNTFFLLLFFFSLMVIFISCFWTIVATVWTFHQQYYLRDWELLLLTRQYEADILTGKDVVSQLRAWPVVAFEVGLRIATCILMIEYLFLVIILSPYTSVSLELETWIALAAYILFTITFSIEPIYRMRLLVAFGLYLTVRIGNLVFALLAGFAYILGVLIAEVVSLAFIVYITVNLLSHSGYGRSATIFTLGCIIPLGIGAVYLIFLVLELLRKDALDRTLKRITRRVE